jgi:hypothetical protein
LTESAKADKLLELVNAGRRGRGLRAPLSTDGRDLACARGSGPPFPPVIRRQGVKMKKRIRKMTAVITTMGLLWIASGAPLTVPPLLTK